MGRIKEAIRRWKLRGRRPADVFADYYRENKWGDSDSRSGKGSNLIATQELRRLLPPFLAKLQIHSMLDLPCGDYFWMSQVDLGVPVYTGGDIVPELIAANRAAYGRAGVSFDVLDLIEGPLPRHDLVFCRDCLVHLSTDHIRAALRNIRASGAEWLLTTTYPGRGLNEDISTGQWRAIDLEKHPFSLGPPAQLLAEGMEAEKGQGPKKSLGLWRVADLPVGGQEGRS